MRPLASSSSASTSLVSTSSPSLVASFIVIMMALGSGTGVAENPAVTSEPALDAAHHSWAIPFGASEADVLAALGPKAKRRTHLTRSDLSPAAVFGSGNKVGESKNRGFSSLEIKHTLGKIRVLFMDDQAYSFMVKKAKAGRHHGIRKGDKKVAVVAVLGQPSEARRFVGGRQLATFRGLHDGQVELLVLFDGGKVDLYCERDIAAWKQAEERLWSNNKDDRRASAGSSPTRVSRK